MESAEDRGERGGEGKFFGKGSDALGLARSDECDKRSVWIPIGNKELCVLKCPKEGGK